MLMPQLVGGHLATGVAGELGGLQMFTCSKVRILIVSSSKRSAFIPKVPAFEAGLPGRLREQLQCIFCSQGSSESAGLEVQRCFAHDLGGQRRTTEDPRSVYYPKRLYGF